MILAIAVAGTYGVAAVGFRLVPGGLFVFGWFLVLAVAFDYPVASKFSPDGVQRRMMLRRQMFDWADVDQLTRTRPTVIRVDRRLEHGGLSLRKGRRKYLLVDRSESGDEFDRLVDLIDVDGTPGGEVGVAMLPRPGDRVPPTWLYRGARWRPESARKR